VVGGGGGVVSGGWGCGGGGVCVGGGGGGEGGVRWAEGVWKGCCDLPLQQMGPPFWGDSQGKYQEGGRGGQFGTDFTVSEKKGPFQKRMMENIKAPNGGGGGKGCNPKSLSRSRLPQIYPNHQQKRGTKLNGNRHYMPKKRHGEPRE